MMNNDDWADVGKWAVAVIFVVMAGFAGMGILHAVTCPVTPTPELTQVGAPDETQNSR